MTPLIEVDTNEKIGILKMVHDTHRHEITHHREIQFRAFSWTNGVFLAILAGLIAFGQAWATYRALGIPVVIVMVGAIWLSTVMLLRRNQKALETNARIVVKVDSFLGLFSSNVYGLDDSIYPEEWLAWGDSRPASSETWFYVATTTVMSVVVIASALVVH